MLEKQGTLRSTSLFPSVQYGFIFFAWCRVFWKGWPGVNMYACCSGDVCPVPNSVKCVLRDCRQITQGCTSPYWLCWMPGSCSQGQERVRFSHPFFWNFMEPGYISFCTWALHLQFGFLLKYPRPQRAMGAIPTSAAMDPSSPAHMKKSLLSRT